MAKQLMEEEKMARRIKKELPKLTKLLQEKLFEWKQENGECFLYNGEDYDVAMIRQEEEWIQYKAEEMQLKLKKRQQAQQDLEENNHFAFGRGISKKNSFRARPLGNSGSNARPPSRVRPRAGSHRPGGAEKPYPARAAIARPRSRAMTS